MKDTHAWMAIARHLSKEETTEEKYTFEQWLNESEENKKLFDKMKDIWQHSPDINTGEPATFIQTLTNKQKIKNFIIDQALGNLIGFIIGMSVTNLFSHYVMEKRSIHNFFGLAGRKKVVVNDVPEWLQWSLSVIAGFIALEFINYLIQQKKHIAAWNHIKAKLGLWQ